MNLNQVTVPTMDIARSIQFYQTLGLKLIVNSPHYARFVCPNGDSTFSVHLVDALPKGNGITVYFEEKNLDKKVSELMVLGLEFESQPTDQRWLWREASLYDPDNNKIILFYGGVNRKDPPWKVGASQI